MSCDPVFVDGGTVEVRDDGIIHLVFGCAGSDKASLYMTAGLYDDLRRLLEDGVGCAGSLVPGFQILEAA